MIRRFFCRLLGHVAPPGVYAEWSITFVCDRCGQLVDGRWAPRHR